MITAQDAKNRVPITIAVMLASLMSTIDTTIANVALPDMQGSVSASPEQITWVLTSYIVAAAIMTPLSGWLADRIGRKLIFLISIGGFTMASMLCGAATSLPEIVVFRVLQGICGAALMPLSQAVLLDINPPEKHGQAMAIWGTGAVVGPVLGPLVGGYFTDNLSWRWCFYINLPVGILAFVGAFLFISGERLAKVKRFDFLGFGMLTLFIAAFQIVLDRGPSQGWFESREIWIEAILALIGLWVFVIHTLTAPFPFFDRALIRDRNFVVSSLFSFVVSLGLYSVMALLAPLMQTLMGYPVFLSGLLSMPRGIGTLISMFAVAGLIGRVDVRAILMTGMGLSGVALWQMTHFDLSMGTAPFIYSGFLQGFGMGLLFVPLTTLAFATIPARLRPEGSSVYTLVRNMGSGVGISIMNALVATNTQAMHASLAAKVITSDATVRASLPAINTAATAGEMALNSELTRQATMVAYVDDFRLMLMVTIACMPVLLFMRTPREPADAELVHAAYE